VASLDRDQPLSEIATMEALLSASVSTRQVTFVLLALFSTLALTLAGIGIYGVMSYAVAERTNELGIRLALGAQRPDLLKSVVGQGIGIAGAGIAIGVLVALGLTRLMSNLLFGVSAVDPVTFAAVGAGVALIALVACAIPGWRVLRVNPLIALRRE
jgi:putative ABC transport system permease protein